MDAREESKIFETVNFPPESEETHETSELEAFVRNYITNNFLAKCYSCKDGNYNVIIKAGHHRQQVQNTDCTHANSRLQSEN